MTYFTDKTEFCIVQRLSVTDHTMTLDADRAFTLWVWNEYNILTHPPSDKIPS
jgi:hypothetical protein